MKTWTRVPPHGLTVHCGRCGHAIASGDPQLVISRKGQTWGFVRCVTCAGEPVPADLPAAPMSSTSADDDDLTPIGAIARGDA